MIVPAPLFRIPRVLLDNQDIIYLIVLCLVASPIDSPFQIGSSFGNVDYAGIVWDHLPKGAGSHKER